MAQHRLAAIVGKLLGQWLARTQTFAGGNHDRSEWGEGGIVLHSYAAR